MGLGAIGGASQTLFGGSGGQDFFEKATWTLGAFFMLGALGISILRTNITDSRLKGFQAQTNEQSRNQQQPLKK
jgi:preprotein translocase subunit SecG